MKSVPDITQVSKPFYSKAKKRYVLRYKVADGRKTRPEITRKSEAAILHERAKLCKQIELTGCSAPYDFEILARLRILEKRAEAANVDLSAIFDEVFQHFTNENVRITIAAAWDKYREGDFRGYEKTTQSTNKSALEKFVGWYGEMPIGRFSKTQVTEHAKRLQESLSRTSTKREMATLKAFFEWAMEPNQEFVRSNPFEGWTIKKFWKAIDNNANRNPPAIHTPDEIQRLIDTTLIHDPMFLPALTLKIFGFLRTCEVRKISPDAIDVKNGTIIVGPAVAKKGANRKPKPRAIEGLRDVFREFMAPFTRADGKLKCLSVANFHPRLSRIYDLAFPEVGMKTTANKFRHTCATYEYTLTKDIGAVRQRMGHQSKSESVTWEHYVDPSQLCAAAEKFFAIRPPFDYADRIAAFQATKKAATVRWPTDDKLQNLVKQIPMIEIATQVGVSEAAVRKRLRTLGIQPPPKGYWARLKALQAREATNA